MNNPNTPFWPPASLMQHYQKRVTRDSGCFEDLLGIRGRLMTLQEYYEFALATFYEPAMCWTAEEWVDSIGEYRSRKCYADPELVLVILDGGETRFITCFHKHFGPPGKHSRNGGPESRMRLKLSRWLDHRESLGQYRNLRIYDGLE
jgi:hypothetical protein